MNISPSGREINQSNIDDEDLDKDDEEEEFMRSGTPKTAAN